MSKLKIYKQSDVMWGHWFTEYCRKDEADKVIADLEESHKKEVGQLLIEIAELKAEKAQAEDDCAYWKTMSRKNADDNEVMAKQRAEAFERECHLKYKRCLAMARWCWAIKELNRFGDQDYMDFAEKWRKRWLELAAKFKPNKE